MSKPNMHQMSDAPDGAFAWIQRDEENAVRVPAFRENGRWVLGYYANGDVEVWADADIAKIELIAPLNERVVDELGERGTS